MTVFVDTSKLRHCLEQKAAVTDVRRLAVNLQTHCYS